jgi:hypothetical protein
LKDIEKQFDSKFLKSKSGWHLKRWLKTSMFWDFSILIS